MIDQRDTKTMQLMNWPRPPGRPKKAGGAMTGAERMKRYRKKKAEEAKTIETRAKSYANHNPGVMIDEMHEGLSGDPDDVIRAKAAWTAYGKLMGWL